MPSQRPLEHAALMIFIPFQYHNVAEKHSVTCIVIYTGA